MAAFSPAVVAEEVRRGSKAPLDAPRIHGSESEWEFDDEIVDSDDEIASILAKTDDAASQKAGKEAKEAKDDSKPKSLKERLENLGRLYKSDDNPYMQELWFLGRYHGQYHGSDGSEGDFRDWENRRLRMGGQARFFEKLTVHAQMVSSNDAEKFYNGFTELWVGWKFHDAVILTVGQQKHRFTHERNTSSRYINTLERSLVVNMFNSEYTPAVTLSGSTDNWMYYTGFFSNSTGPDMWDSFTDLDSGFSYLMSATRDVSDSFEFDSTHLNVCYLYSDANENANFWNHFKDGISAGLFITHKRRYLLTEGVYGGGSRIGDAYGLSIQPGVFLTDKLQLATRYQLAFSNEENGLVAQRRYERPAGMTTGDMYHAGYAGLNYFIAGHRIKLMSGVEYSNLNGQDLWTGSFMFRTFWGPHSSGPFPMAKML